MQYLVHHLLRASAERLPDKEALVQQDRRITYGQAWPTVRSVAAGLRAAGIRRGDRVGILLPGGSLEGALAIFAISAAGGVFVPVSDRLFPSQVAHIARDCGMRGLVTTPGRLGALAPLLGGLDALSVFVTVADGTSAEAGVRAHAFEALSGGDVGEAGDEAIGKDLAALLYTSGSTGAPKGVMLSHANVLAGSRIVASYLDLDERERLLAVLPFTFDAGLNQLITAVEQGGTCVLSRFVFGQEVTDLLHRERITGLAGVPTFWALMTQETSGLEARPPGTLRYITNTGGALPPSTLARLRQWLPRTTIYLMYGLTEAFRSTYLPPAELDRRPTSIGKAIPDTEILVLNEDGRPCKPGEVGELVHRGPTVSLGYWGAPDLTARVLRPHPLSSPEMGDAERVCYSGDYVTADEEGFLYFVGRRDAMIKSSGIRISPTEVEDVLHASGLVKHCAVIGVPDEILGHAVKAFVVARDGVVIDAQELLAFCASRLPRYMVPGAVERLDDMPLTTSGKIDYPALRRREGLP